jgi:hypothetical protein
LFAAALDRDVGVRVDVVGVMRPDDAGPTGFLGVDDDDMESKEKEKARERDSQQWILNDLED